jgi:hypothetical protein
MAVPVVKGERPMIKRRCKAQETQARCARTSRGSLIRRSLAVRVLVFREAVVTDEAGMRVGDCVAVERGSYVNLRLMDDRQCTPGARPTSNATREAATCNAAKDEV